MDTPAFGQFRKVLIGFSQGGYLSYRMVAEHPDVFDAAILLSPSFKGEAASEPVAGHTRFALCYGTADRTIPAANQQCARAKPTATGNCTVFEYPGMAHAVCDQEIIDLRNWLKY
ncbi:alpha/beta hydrolase [Bifidobacterium pseudocatenulatum]|uniref:alpha/beta hydrolase n=1 Tax=Bifidobacterium pseudocatenulatum TaxID=28026 RepID=UPI003A523348